MGYRSCVAIMMYGDKKDCDVVCDLFTASGIDQELKELFDRQKQEHTVEKGLHFVFWSFDDIKWYGDCQEVQQRLFTFVNDIEGQYEDEEPPQERRHLAIEYVRVGEETDDNEYEASEYNDWYLQITRRIDHPDFFEWKV